MSDSHQQTIRQRRIIVIGGSAAGAKAAARARRLDENARIIIFQRSAELSTASCGYPYYIGGAFDDRNLLLCTPTGTTRDASYYLETKNIVAYPECEVTHINREARVVTVLHLRSQQWEQFSYDKLILATGATPNLPGTPGISLSGITTLHSMQDADYLRTIRSTPNIKKAVVVGGGLIGMEACEALRRAGFEVTLVELQPQVLPFLDLQLAKLVQNHVESKGVPVITGKGVSGFLGADTRLIGLELSDGTMLDCQLAVIAIGVTPNSMLAQRSGLELGSTSGILVNEHLQTSDPDIYAAGDCIECWNSLLGTRLHAPYGDLANLQGRVAGENAILGDSARFPGTTQTGICSVFNFAAGWTGLSEAVARTHSQFEVTAVINAGLDKPGYLGGKLLFTKLVADRKTGKILGAQCVGPGDVSRQIATWAMAIQGGFTVNQMACADLPYAPPFSQAIDHSIVTAHLLQNKFNNYFEGITATELKLLLDSGHRPFMLDCRDLAETEQLRLGVGEHLIPLASLRNRINELPTDKSASIITFCKISLRGYEAARILQANGFTNVKVLEGGIAAWPFPREK